MNKADVTAVEHREVILLGVPFHDVTMEETLQHMDRMVASGRPGYLATANLDFAAQAGSDVELQRILFDADLVLCDGTPLVWASHWVGAPLRERVAGSDLLPELFAHAAGKGHRIFFLGSSDEVLAIARAKCAEAWPKLDICGAYAPPYAKLLELDDSEIERRIREAKPDILLVAMGCPKQEKWIYMNYRRLKIPVCIGIGASLDFIAGKFRRAPVWMRVCGLEWVFRLLQEPRRLFSRYWMDLLFFVSTLREQKRMLRDAGGKRGLSGRSEAQSSGYLPEYFWTGRVDAAAVNAQKVQAMSAEPARPNAIIDCSGVTFMDSTGLGLLVKSYRSCKRAGGTLIVRAPGSQVRSLLVSMKLDRLIPVADTEEQVLEFFRAGRPGGMESAAQDGEAGVLTVHFSGDITAATVEDCQKSLDAAWKRTGEMRVLQLDLGKVAFIDSSGLGFLVKTLKLVRRGGEGTLILQNVTPNVRNVIRLAKLETILGMGES